jgi:hypothetical protein
VFRLNGEPCGGCSGGVPLSESSDGGIFSVGEGREYQEELSTGCEDYDKWMALTKEEKFDGLEVNPEIHAILESLADSNDNDHMSCDELTMLMIWRACLSNDTGSVTGKMIPCCVLLLAGQ